MGRYKGGTKWEDVFFSRLVETESGCLEYTGTIHHSGYGTIQINGKTQLTHRVAWQLVHGVAGDLDVLHKCDNRKCCNTKHLFLGTNMDNIKDRQNKFRQAKGAKVFKSKLGEKDIPAIRDHLSMGEKISDVARWYGMSACAISNIYHRKTWKHI